MSTSKLLTPLLLGVFLMGCKGKVADSADVVTMPVVVKAVERTVSFEGAGGFKLEGTLMVPPGELDVRRPAVLLVSGSGPTDRDGNQPGLKTDTLKQFAKALAAAGVASFRFDKRAVARYASEWPKDPGKIGPFFSWKNHIGDARGAWDAMRADESVDPAKCAILGHSEGGLVALALSEVAKPQALVLVGTPGRTFEALVREQLERQLGPMGAEGHKLLAESRRLSQEILSSGKVPEDVPLALKALYNPSIGVYYQEVGRLEPTTLLKRFDGPVLVLNGQEDVQVSAERDAKALFAATSEKKGSQLVVLPLASHNLKPVEASSDPGFEGEIVPEAIEAVQEFLSGVIGAKVPRAQTDVH